MKVGIVITDANILIDLIHLELFTSLFGSDLFEFKTTDFVFEELYDEQKDVLQAVIKAERFQIIESEESDLIKIYAFKQKSQGLSIQDCSALYYALKLKGILLTGDSAHRKQTKQSGVEVHGILYLFDQMVVSGLISFHEAFERLQKLKEINNRLPKNEIEKRLKEWKA